MGRGRRSNRMDREATYFEGKGWGEIGKEHTVSLIDVIELEHTLDHPGVTVPDVWVIGRGGGRGSGRGHGEKNHIAPLPMGEGPSRHGEGKEITSRQFKRVRV